MPSAAICARIVDLAPSPIATIAITAPTPMMMPSIVRKARSLFLASARSASAQGHQGLHLMLHLRNHLFADPIGNHQTVAKDNLPPRIRRNIGFVGDENNRDAPAPCSVAETKP